MRRLSALFVVLVVVSLIGTAGVVIAGDSYELSVDGEIETPSQERTIAGDTVVVDSVATVDPGEEIVVHASRDVSDTGWDIQLRDLEDPEGTVAFQEQDPAATEATEQFDTDGLDPGTYIALVQEDLREFKAAVPVVVAGYELDVEHPAEATANDEVTVSVEITDDQVGEPPADIEVTIHRPGTEDAFVETAESVGSNTYEATLSLDDAAEADYDVYAAAVGGETDDGYPNVMGIGEGETLSVSADETDDGDNGDTAPPPDDDNGDNGDTAPPPDDDNGDNETDEEQDGEREDAEEINVTQSAAALEVNETAGTTTAVLNETSIERVTFNTTEATGTVSVSEFDEPPEESETAPGASLTTVAFEVPDELTDEPATIRTNLSQERLVEHDAEAEDLVMTRYVDEGWERLVTELTDETNESVVLEVETPGFSLFGVSAVSAPEAVLDIDPEEVEVGEDVALDASNSTDQYGELVDYEWHVDGEELDGESTVTRTFDEAGEYDVELTVENDAGETDTASGTVQVVEVESDEFELTVEVTDAEGKAIEGATVSVDGEQATTAEGGTTTFELPEGTYTVEADADGFEPASHEVTLTDSQTETVTLEPETDDSESDEHELTVEVVGEGGAIDGAEVTIDGDDATTGEDGTVRFELSPGEYTIDVDADGYEPASEEIYLDEDMTAIVEVLEESDGFGLTALLLAVVVIGVLGGGALYYYLQQN